MLSRPCRKPAASVETGAAAKACHPANGAASIITPPRFARRVFLMKIQRLHSWNLTPTEAVALQRELAARVDARTPLTRCDLIAGADVSYNRFSPIFYAAVVILRT